MFADLITVSKRSSSLEIGSNPKISRLAYMCKRPAVIDILFGVLVKVSGNFLVEHLVPFIDVVDFSIFVVLLGSLLFPNAAAQVSFAFLTKS